MAQSKKPAKAEKVSPFWKPKEAGDTIGGKFESYQPTRTPDGDTGLAIALDTGKLIPVGYSVGHSLRENEVKLKKGDTLKFTYVGKGGRSKVVQIALNGKDVPIPSAFAPATETEVQDFFERLDEKVSLAGKKAKGKK